VFLGLFFLLLLFYYLSTKTCLSTQGAFEGDQKTVFVSQFVACRNPGSTHTEIDELNDVNGRNFGFKKFRQVFDSIPGDILNLWAATSNLA
jgi:hypothetical protein